MWLDHKPAAAVGLNTVFQPNMKKRKSVTKLTEVKDIVNSKTSKYCLTTQEQDTDGELETKLYKVRTFSSYFSSNMFSIRLVVLCIPSYTVFSASYENNISG